MKDFKRTFLPVKRIVDILYHIHTITKASNHLNIKSVYVVLRPFWNMWAHSFKHEIIYSPIFFPPCKDEKNQLLTTNAWLQMVSIMDNINVILICVYPSPLQMHSINLDASWISVCMLLSRGNSFFLQPQTWPYYEYLENWLNLGQMTKLFVSCQRYFL